MLLPFIVASMVGVFPLQVQQDAPAPLQVLKISSGPSGHEVNGTFAIDVERAQFNRTDDHQVVVVFLWQGTPGPHKLVANWRSPDGSLSASSSLDYEARSTRFSAYWTMPLMSALPLGMWSIEATVDGRPGGRYTFELTDHPVAATPVKPILDQAQLYERLGGAVAFVRYPDARDADVPSTAALADGAGHVRLPLDALDDVSSVELVGPEGKTEPVGALLAWNRTQNWAVVPFHGAAAAIRSAERDPRIGDRCYSLVGSPTNGWLLLEGAVSGRSPDPSLPFALATFYPRAPMAGAPVVNEYGELLGMVAGRDRPGNRHRPGLLFSRQPAGAGTAIVPLAMMPVGSAALTPVADLRRTGEVLRPIDEPGDVISGGFADAVPKGSVSPKGQKETFSMTAKSFAVFVTWNSSASLRGETVLTIYAPNNRPIVRSEPRKLAFSRGAIALSSWTVPMLPRPGVYRAELTLNETLVWRDFVEIAR